MIQALCIEKIRNKNNQITHYRMQDKDGKQLVVTSKQVKDAILNKRIDILNLTLTSDNRLIDKEYKPQQSKVATLSKQEPTSLEKFLAKAIMLGYEIKDVTTLCEHRVYFAIKQENAILYIPDAVIRILPDDLYEISKTSYFKTLVEIRGTLKVLGGKNLKSSVYMFHECQAKILDISNLDTSNVTDMSGMFQCCKAQTLDLSNFNTSNVINMSKMFVNCQAQTLDLSNFNTSKVTDMSKMFVNCKAQTLDLSNFNTSNVKNTSQMFECCQVKNINLSKFNTSKVTNMTRMFLCCKAQTINLSSFNTSNVTNMDRMFCGCKTQTLDLSSFNISKVIKMNNMFYDCDAQIIKNF